MKYKKPLLTVCIPVYKSEAYIGYAIDDMLGQTFKDFECLIIDDRTPDSAIAVAKSRIGDDSRFRFISNVENLGVSETRNKGLVESKGTYIIFLDSDDRFDLQLLERVAHEISTADKEGFSLDVITWEFGGVGDDNSKIKQLEDWRFKNLADYGQSRPIYSPMDAADRLFQINLNSMCTKAFRIDHLKRNKITFDSTIKFGEDALFGYQAICVSDKIAAIPKDNILYFYRREQISSAMHTINFSDQMKYQLETISKLQIFLEERNIMKIYEKSYKKWIADGVGSILARLNSQYDQKSVAIDREIEKILSSRSWKMMRLLRKLRKQLL